jgi:methyl-accepting chemotaxis protein
VPDRQLVSHAAFGRAPRHRRRQEFGSQPAHCFAKETAELHVTVKQTVDSARAGEQGRGFAVVASEVRSLAQRSARAAKELKVRIATSVDNVDSGSRLVSDAGSLVQEIVGSVERVTDLIGEITAATNEQSQGIGQINTAVNEFDRMTQQNAAFVEGSAAAAASLKEQAGRLAKSVRLFKLQKA